MSLPEVGRQVAHVYLDAVAVWDVEKPTVENGRATDLLLQRLDELGITDPLDLVMPGVMLLTAALHANLPKDALAAVALLRETVDDV